MSKLASLIEELRAALPALSLRENERLSEHCSFRIGGECAAFAEPTTEEEIRELCRILRRHGEAPILMGNGSNLLIADGFIDRIVLHLGSGFSAVERRGETGLYAQSGVTLYKLAMTAAEHSLTGLEFAHGIPGTLGGAVSMNAGAYGGEMVQVVRSVRYLSSELELKETDELQFAYRHSRFSDTDDIILGAAIELQRGEEAAIREQMKTLMEKRRASQPLDMPSAGSTFKRPVGGYAAALIDQAGLKGFSIGGAQVSEKHAGFVVNKGGASCEDVLRLMDAIKERVYAASGIELEAEVKMIRG